MTSFQKIRQWCYLAKIDDIFRSPFTAQSGGSQGFNWIGIVAIQLYLIKYCLLYLWINLNNKFFSTLDRRSQGITAGSGDNSAILQKFWKFWQNIHLGIWNAPGSEHFQKNDYVSKLKWCFPGLDFLLRFFGKDVIFDDKMIKNRNFENFQWSQY